MMPFQIPSHTRYDLNFSIAGIPVRVHPLFWLMAIFFGGLSGSLLSLLIWVVCVFVSILIHELGHSLMMRRYGVDSYIVLYIGGGLAVPEGGNGRYRSRYVEFTTKEQVLVSFAGPLAGFLFAGLIVGLVALLGGVVFMSRMLWVLPMPAAFLPAAGGVVNSIISTLLWINVFWGYINLTPVFPLDGGQIARRLLVQADPWDGVRKSLWLSVVAGVVVAIVGAFFLRSMYMALLFGLLAFQSYEMLHGRSSNWF